MEIDKECLAKAIGICCLGWTALPIIYLILKKSKEKKN